MVTDPFGRSQAQGDAPSTELSAAVVQRAMDDRLPATLLNKLIGLGLCLPNVLCKSAESELKFPTAFTID